MQQRWQNVTSGDVYHYGWKKKVFRLVESEQIHSIEPAEGKLLICADSAVNFEK